MKLIWADLETTGLEPDKCNILEVAVAIASLEAPFDHQHVYQAVTHLSASDISGLDPFIVNMHNKSGLLMECLASSLLISQVETQLLDIIPWVENKDERPILAGSSIHFDHSFITHHMPTLAKRLSHRHYDVSAFKLFAQSKGMAKFPKAEAHRAKDDIDESVSHAKACDAWLCAHYQGKLTGILPPVC